MRTALFAIFLFVCILYAFETLFQFSLLFYNAAELYTDSSVFYKHCGKVYF